MQGILKTALGSLALLCVLIPMSASAQNCYGTYDVYWKSADDNTMDFSVFSRAGRFQDTGDCRGRNEAVDLMRRGEAKGKHVKLMNTFMGISRMVFVSESDNRAFGLSPRRDSETLYATVRPTPAPTLPVVAAKPPQGGGDFGVYRCVLPTDWAGTDDTTDTASGYTHADLDALLDEWS